MAMIDSSITTWPISDGVSRVAGRPGSRSSRPVRSWVIQRAVRGNAAVSRARGWRATRFSMARYTPTAWSTAPAGSHQARPPSASASSSPDFSASVGGVVDAVASTISASWPPERSAVIVHLVERRR